MNVREIKIFIASSNELCNERARLVYMFSQVNELLLANEIILVPQIWEFKNESISKSRKQDEYNAILYNCDIILVMFWKKCGQYTKEEFYVAREEQEKNQEKRLFVYFKRDEHDSEDIKNFKNELYEKYENFGATFDNIDELEKKFLIEIFRYLTEKNYLSESVFKITNVNKVFDSQRQQVIELAFQFSKFSNEKISERIKAAREAFEKGDIEIARKELDLDVIDAESEFELKTISDAVKNLELKIKEYSLCAKVYATASNLDYAERVDKINRTYLMATRIAEELGLKDFEMAQLIFEYANIFMSLHIFGESIELYGKAYALYGETLQENIINARAEIASDLAILYQDNSNKEKAEEYFNIALALTEELIAIDAKKYYVKYISTKQNKIIQTLNNKTLGLEDAEKELENLLIETRIKSDSSDPYIFQQVLLLTNLGCIKEQQKNNAEARKKYDEALAIIQNTDISKIDNKLYYLGTLKRIIENEVATYQMLSIIPISIVDPWLDNAKKTINEYCKIIYRELEPVSKLTVDAKFLYAATMLDHATIMNSQEALEKYNSAVEIYKSLIFLDPLRIVPLVGYSLRRIALLYIGEHDYEKAIKACEEGLKTVNKYSCEVGPIGLEKGFLLCLLTSCYYERSKEDGVFVKYKQLAIQHLHNMEKLDMDQLRLKDVAKLIIEVRKIHR